MTTETELKEIFMNDIEVELRKLYLRHVDEEKQAELNLWITEIEPVLRARKLKLQVGKPYRRDYAWRQVLRIGGRRQRLFRVEMSVGNIINTNYLWREVTVADLKRVRQLVADWLRWTENNKGEIKLPLS